MLVNTGMLIFMAFMRLVLIVLRFTIRHLPEKGARELMGLEENLSFMADDGDKLILPGHQAILACFGWFLIYLLVFDSIFEIIKKVKGW
jgi:hypothetical protein